MNGKLKAKIKTAIKENIASHEVDDPVFGNTSLGFKRFEIMYGAEFTPKSCETMRTIIVAVKHKDVEGNNVTVFEVRDYAEGQMVAMFDGRASIDFENNKVNYHNVHYGGFTKEYVNLFFKRMFESMNLETL